MLKTVYTWLQLGKVDANDNLAQWLQGGILKSLMLPAQALMVGGSLAIASGLPLLMGSPARAQSSPFTEGATCLDDTFLFKTANNLDTATDIYVVNLITGQETLVARDVTSATGATYLLNGVGFSDNDDYIYGYDLGRRNGHIVKIGSDYQVIDLGPVAGLPTNIPFTTGDVSPDGKRYYLYRQGLGSAFYVIDIDPTSSTYLTVIQSVFLGQASILDWAFNPIDGQIYTVTTGSVTMGAINTLLRINPSTGAIENLGDTALGEASTVVLGAMYFDSNGFLYVGANSGNIYRVDVSDPASLSATQPIDPTTQVSFLNSGQASFRNDGARCVSASLPIDFGDAPDTGSGVAAGNYQTLLADGGPLHELDGVTFLGAGVSADTDGFGDGIDNSNGGLGGNASDDADDDGVRLNGATLQGQTLALGASLTLDIAASGNGVLNAWMDWNHDGDFADADEQIAVDADVTNGTITVLVPATATVGSTYARFRYSTNPGLSPTGIASDGEVEDYQIAIAATVTYPVSSLAGQILINEVLYNETGNSAATNDEFIELYNASSVPIDVSGWQVIDGNLPANDTDGSGSITGNATNPAYRFPAGTTLAPKAYAVIWIGDMTPDHQAPNAAFQTWLGRSPKLNNNGDDVWLYDDQTQLVDYIAYGEDNAINQPPPSPLNIWIDTYQSDLGGAIDGQSISLTPNGQDSNTSGCWELTISALASSRCPGFVSTQGTGVLTVGFSSVGSSNHGIPRLALVKRITAINEGTGAIAGDDLLGYLNDPNDPNDDANYPWPIPIDDYLIGGVDGGRVLPTDELEYTIYFLSHGDVTARNVVMCDYVPADVVFIPNAYRTGPTPDTGGVTGAGLPGADVGIALSLGGTEVSLTNASDGDGGYYFPAGVDPADTFPGLDCDGDGDGVNANQNGAIVVRLGNLPAATAPGIPVTAYGYVRFRGRVQ